MDHSVVGNGDRTASTEAVDAMTASVVDAIRLVPQSGGSKGTLTNHGNEMKQQAAVNARVSALKAAAVKTTSEKSADHEGNEFPGYDYDAEDIDSSGFARRKLTATQHMVLKEVKALKAEHPV
jgi:hypothetical protein